jgi:RND family efflux transporter MFP subunit
LCYYVLHMLYVHLILRQLTKVGYHLVIIGRIIWSFVKSRPYSSALVTLLIVGGALATSFFFAPPENEGRVTDTRSVTLIRVGDALSAEPLSLIGTVRATREALVSSDIPGTVSGVYRTLGDFVTAGTIIAELKNDTQRAQVAQARAALQKAESGVAVGGIGVGNAESAFKAAEDSARATILSAITTIDDTVRRKADTAFTNPTSAQPNFAVSTSNSQLVNEVESGRLRVQAILARQQSVQVSRMSTDELIAELERISQEVKTVQAFMQTLVLTLNTALATFNISDASIALYRADASAGLAAANALSASIPQSIDGLKARRAAVQIAETALATGTDGTSADISGAQANLAAALANLERTLIRAPISGTINRLDLDVGSFVNASQPIVYLTSAGGLEVVAFVSGNDIKDIAIGSRATIGTDVQGTVVRVANALDPVTKKAEIRIALPPSAPLVSGQSATLRIDRAVKKQSATDTLAIPIAAIKITPEGPLVFTLNDANALVANSVVLGALRGSTVVVESGITADARIVSDARGLKEGQVVLPE